MLGVLSDIGNNRDLNEDYTGFLEDDCTRFYVIADGMGGHNAGEVASKLAVEKAIDYIKSHRDVCPQKELIKNAIDAANIEIYKYAQQSVELKGMGTTITACLVINNTLTVANVGDSRCYAIYEDRIEKITKDHSLVQQLLDNGSITEEEAYHHPNKNIITRALGTSKNVEIDIFELGLEKIKKVLICSDGLSNDVYENEMFEIAINNDNQVACINLVELSKQKGSRDNISVIIFEGECKDDRYFTRK